MSTFYNILVVPSGLPAITLNVITAGYSLFGVSFLYVMEFLGKVLLVFAGSALVSKLLKLDKAYDHLHEYKNV
jgi:hypothetical protein